MRLVQLTNVDIRIGEPLPWPVYDRSGKLLLKKGEIVASETQLRGVLDRGHLDEASKRAANREGARDDSLLIGVHRRSSPVFDQIHLLSQRLTELHRTIRLGASETLVGQFQAVADGLREALRRDADAVLASLQVDAPDNRFAERHLHVAALCELMAKVIGMPADERRSLCCAALSFDIGFAELHDRLDKQAQPLSEDQLDALHRHPVTTVAMLKAARVDDPIWLLAVQQHHERIDGSGYPEHLKASAVGLPARMLAIADTYSAMIRPRAYRAALHSRQALREIFLERGRRIDETLAAVFIKEIGIYPPGTFVRLANGELAVVSRRTHHAAHPAVRALIGRDGIPLQRPLPRDCRLTETVIVDLVSRDRLGPVLERLSELWAEGASEAAARPEAGEPSAGSDAGEPGEGSPTEAEPD